jgi:hypothetical protein
MADRTHFYPIEKSCDMQCQRYDRKSNALYFCQHFEITDMLPIGDGSAIPHVNGYCLDNYYQEENK